MRSMLRLFARALAVVERGHFLLITAGGSALIAGAVVWSFAQLTNAPVVAQAFLGVGVFCLALVGVRPLARRALAPYERRRQIEALVENLRTLVNELSGFLAARGVDVPRPGELQAYWQRLREGPSGALAQLRAVADDVETMAIYHAKFRPQIVPLCDQATVLGVSSELTRRAAEEARDLKQAAELCAVLWSLANKVERLK